MPTLKEVLALVTAAERAGSTVGVAIHTLVRAPLPALSIQCGLFQSDGQLARTRLLPCSPVSSIQCGSGTFSLGTSLRYKDASPPPGASLEDQAFAVPPTPAGCGTCRQSSGNRQPVDCRWRLQRRAPRPMLAFCTLIEPSFSSHQSQCSITKPQELLESLTFASECGSLISPPCWKTGQFCTGKLAEPYTPSLKAKPTPLLERAHNRSLAVYPFTFRNEVRLCCRLLRQEWLLLRLSYVDLRIRHGCDLHPQSCG